MTARLRIKDRIWIPDCSALSSRMAWNLYGISGLIEAHDRESNSPDREVVNHCCERCGTAKSEPASADNASLIQNAWMDSRILA